MILYHLDKWKYRKVWPPEGALFADGRWNKPGQWVVYSSPTVSLAKLEILANENNLPIKRVCLTIEVADTVEVFSISARDLPHDWMDIPYPVGLVKVTEQFIESGKLLMRVPSAQSYREYNYLINVRHPDFIKKVKLRKVVEEPFDSRLERIHS